MGPFPTRGATAGRAHAALAGVCLLATVLPLGSAVWPGPTGPPPFNVSLSDTPSSTNPLLIAFTLTVVPGTPTLINWSFGDRTYWNGSGSAYFTPSHLYPTAATYNVSVLVHEGSASAAQWLIIHLTNPTLSVTAQAQNTSGPAPLTVSFAATVLGGSGTYRSFFWTFGDGGTGSGLVIQYTYLHSGRFVAVINVTDSLGSFSRSSVIVNVSAGGASRGTLGPTPLSIATWAAGGAAGGALASALAVVWLMRRRAGLHPPGATVVPERVANGPLTLPAPVPAGAASERENVGAAVQPIREGESTAAAASSDSLRLSQRIVVHIAGLGILADREVAPVGFSQLGMAEALNVRQNRLTNVLRRLVAAGVLTEELRHVQGRPRRLKVYRLTPRGEGLAWDVRHRRPREPGAGATRGERDSPRTRSGDGR